MEHRTLALTSAEHFGGRVPLDACGALLSRFGFQLCGAVSVAFRRRSAGRRPAWLDRAADIRFVGLDGTDDTILHFEAPRLGDAAEELYEQKELWPSAPQASWTGFEVLAGAVRDLAAGDVDSDRYDVTFLRGMESLGRVMRGRFSSASIEDRSGAAVPAVVNRRVVEQAGEMVRETPASRRVRVAGLLDMIRVSTQSFALKLDSGVEVRGVLGDVSVSELRGLLDHRVVVQGHAVYRPSGRALRLDADSVELGTSEPSRWSVVPPPLDRPRRSQRLRQAQSATTGVNAIFGQWPGEELDQQLLAMLDEAS